ncbi:MAG: glycerophosphoryl diester phosphodiesterase [Nitrospira sp. WS110]|nr:glycerophosphoryl diester phosphodiesterase [Nitrospira sp. WS110]
MAKESPQRGVLRIGHRGTCGYQPENTLASIEYAITLRCHFTEVDVRRTADEALVLLHDEQVNRTTNGQGPIADLTLEDTQQLAAGNGQKVPTLEEALTMASGRIGLILEFKVPGLAYDVCATVRGSGFNGPVIYASFLHEELQHVRRIDPQALTLALFKRLPENPSATALNLQATHVGVRIDAVTKPLLCSLHEAGLMVFVYTVDNPVAIKRMKMLGVDGIISDFPDRV